MVYQEFQLLATGPQVVRREKQKLVEFQVQVAHSPAGEVVSGVGSQYDSRQLRALLDEAETDEFGWPEAMELGFFLAEALFPEAVRDLLSRSLDLVKAEGKGLRLRLMLDGDLHNVPWEYVLLNRAGGEATATDFLVLSPEVSMVRHQAAQIPAPAVEAGLPARMVAALSSPDGWPNLAVGQERQLIEEALADNGRIEVTWKHPALKEELWAGVERAHLFHFAGHGDFRTHMSAQPGIEEGEGLLVLEDEYGDPQELAASELARHLRAKGVRVAVLGACRSGRRDGVNVWSSIAAALLKADLGAVVGMQDKIRDDSAKAFAGEFYRALVAGLTIDEAVTAGRIKVADEDVRGWATPVLYLRAEDGVIFREYAADPDLEPVRRQLLLESEQRVGTVRGKLTGIRVRGMIHGEARVVQQIDVVEEGGDVTGIDADLGSIDLW